MYVSMKYMSLSIKEERFNGKSRCATSRNVPGSIPGHWGFFSWRQAVPCALGSTQPLKMSTRIFPGIKTAGA